jgi:hypothetical protein
MASSVYPPTLLSQKCSTLLFSFKLRNTCRYWQLQRPMFIVAIVAATTGMAAAGCYLYIFASDSAEETFLKGKMTSAAAPPVFISLLVLQPLEFFSYMSSMVMLQLRMVDLCFNRQVSGPRNRAVPPPTPSPLLLPLVYLSTIS